MQEPWDQIPMFPIYKCDAGEFTTLQEAAKALGTVTVNLSHSLQRRPGDFQAEVKKNYHIYKKRSELIQQGNYVRTTLLKEINAVMRTPTAKIKNLYRKQCGNSKLIKPVSLAQSAVEALLGYIERHWDSNARHVVFHSSGYDTRIVTALLRRLADKNGIEWLGDIRFCSFQPEIQDAYAIWKETGWPRETWFPVDENANPTDYYSECFGFKKIGENMSEAERFWGGPFLTQIRLEESRYLNSNHLQGVTALFSDETSKWNRKQWDNVGWFTGCWFFDNPGVLPGRPDCRFLLPFTSVPWLNLLTKHCIPVTINEFKLLMLNQIAPDLANIDRFPNFKFSMKEMRNRNLKILCGEMGIDAASSGLRGHADQQWISKETASKMEHDYSESWYSREFGPSSLGFEKDRVFRYWDDKNTHYMKAAIYQHMIDTGIRVN